MNARQKRTRYIIDKDFQLAFILKFCALVLVSSLAIGLLVFFLNRSSTTVAIENTQVVIKSTADFILPMLTLTVLIVAVFSSLIWCLMALVFSHRIAGPLYRLRREIEMLTEGDFTRRFAVRSKDHLKDLARSLGILNDTFKSKHGQLKKKTESLRFFLKEKNYCIALEDRDRFVALLKEIDDLLNFFKV